MSGPAELRRDRLRVGFRVADHVVALEGFPVAEEPFLPRHYPGFYEIEPARADVVVECRLTESIEPIIPLPSGEDPPVVEVTGDGAERTETRSHWHEGAVDFESGRGAVRFLTADYLPFRMSLENFLRVTFANLLIRHDACLVHAAGVLAGGGAHVFVGLSGSGKSRIVELSPGRPALSDDMIVLLARGGRAFAERVPFFGLYPSTDREGGRHQVRTLLFPRRSKVTEIRPLRRALQLARLRACLPFLDDRDPRGLTACGRLLDAVPARELVFADDDSFWALLA